MFFDEIIDSLEMVKEEVGIPKNLKQKINEIINILLDEKESEEIRSHKAEALLEEISDDNSLQAFVRTQIYQVISLM